MPRNRLLRALPAAQRARALGHLELVELEQGRVLVEVERPLERIWFIERGVAAVMSAFADGSAVETATVGSEGIVGLCAFHGVSSTPEQIFMQLSGAAYALPAAALDALLDDAPALRPLLHRLSVAMFTVAAQSSACSRKHDVAQRSARWLLAAHHHSDGAELGVTHAFLSRMLGVRRASITEALNALQRAGAIYTARGRVAVRDVPRLEQSACGCYAVMRHALDRVTFENTGPSPLAGVVTSPADLLAFDDGDDGDDGEHTDAAHG